MIGFGFGCVIGLVTMTWMSLRYAERTDPTKRAAKERSIAEKRRVLERQRKNWWDTLQIASEKKDEETRKAASTRVIQIDQELLKLAEEEKEL